MDGLQPLVASHEAWQTEARKETDGRAHQGVARIALLAVDGARVALCAVGNLRGMM